jgi:tRNA (guanine9-N1)-methyltransferase
MLLDRHNVDGEADKPLETSNQVIYLSSESDNTINELRPYGIYVIGGLVDRNRHKGICYKRAMDREVMTAKLPIGEFLQMNSRYVLATNHVNEIMLKWLEVGDWGDAFMKVIPKRKGGALKTQSMNGDGVEKADSEAARPSKDTSPESCVEASGDESDHLELLENTDNS